MAFIKKTWLARIGVGLNRFRMNNSTDVVLESNPVSVTQQGDQLSADNMNNLETRIGNAFDEMAGNLAPIEISPASTNHAVGTQIVYNGILYKVTSAISTDDNLVVGTNISPYPVSSAISDIMVESNNSIKFRDGTMLYWNSDTFSPTQVGINNTSTPSLPSDFVSTSSYFVSCYQENMAGVYVSNTSRNNNVLDLYFYCPSASYTVHYTYLVIGRWK